MVSPSILMQSTTTPARRPDPPPALSCPSVQPVESTSTCSRLHGNDTVSNRLQRDVEPDRTADAIPPRSSHRSWSGRRFARSNTSAVSEPLRHALRIARADGLRWTARLPDNRPAARRVGGTVSRPGTGSRCHRHSCPGHPGAAPHQGRGHKGASAGGQEIEPMRRVGTFTAGRTDRTCRASREREMLFSSRSRASARTSRSVLTNGA